MKLVVLLLMSLILLKNVKLYSAVNINDNVTNNGINNTRSQDMLQCCVSKSCACHYFIALLVNVTSTNVTNILVYITTDMVLFSVIHLTDLKSISVIGYNNILLYSVAIVEDYTLYLVTMLRLRVSLGINVIQMLISK